jgi:hypothetical protein
MSDTIQGTVADALIFSNRANSFRTDQLSSNPERGVRIETRRSVLAPHITGVQWGNLQESYDEVALLLLNGALGRLLLAAFRLGDRRRR